MLLCGFGGVPRHLFRMDLSTWKILFKEVCVCVHSVVPLFVTADWSLPKFLVHKDSQPKYGEFTISSPQGIF